MNHVRFENLNPRFSICQTFSRDYRTLFFSANLRFKTSTRLNNYSPVDLTIIVFNRIIHKDTRWLRHVQLLFDAKRKLQIVRELILFNYLECYRIIHKENNLLVAIIRIIMVLYDCLQDIFFHFLIEAFDSLIPE